ncbi:cytochrome P450 [Lactarius vividus]|nr:cytochrome P450 [Lactarius vividus]
MLPVMGTRMTPVDTTIQGHQPRYSQSPWRKLPPGPRGLPLLGNALQLCGPQWLTFIKWNQQFGDIFYLNAMGQPIVVLNTQKAAADLLDHRAEIYSDRPRIIVAGEILCGGLAIPLQTCGPLWVPQINEAILLTSGLLAQPAMRDQHIRRTTASIAMTITYDTPSSPIVSEQDPRVKAIDDIMARVTRATLPGAHLVELFPWMLHIPSSLSLAGTWIKNSGLYGLSEREGAWLAGMAYAGDSDLSAAAIEWWMLAMVTYPDVQRRAQAELDAHLPYIRATIKEVLRWRPMAPLGLPHRLTKDDWYNGMFIPKGTTMIANVWHLNRDPTIYGADAAHFNPGRFLDANGELAQCPPETMEEGHVTYGFGRRVCPGRHTTNKSFFIDIAMVLWACNIEPGKDEHRNVIPIDVDRWVDGLHIRPVPFKANISPRFPEAAALLVGERELSVR